jgi:hypothetical protein
MSHKQARIQALPVTDYQNAIAGAVQWLGDRYLLAQPVNAIHRTEPYPWQRGRASTRRYVQWLAQSSSSQAS